MLVVAVMGLIFNLIQMKILHSGEGHHHLGGEGHHHDHNENGHHNHDDHQQSEIKTSGHKK